MKKINPKIISVLLAFLMIVGSFPIFSIVSQASTYAAWYSERINTRLANCNSTYYTTQNPMSAGQCTWYCFGRAWEKCGVQIPRWGTNSQGDKIFGNANMWYSNAQNAGWSTGNEIRSNSIACYGSTHVIFIEWVDGNDVYYTEANNPRDDALDANDGKLKKNTVSHMKNTRGGGTYQGCIYLESPYDIDTSYSTPITAYIKSSKNVQCYSSVNGSASGWVYPEDKCIIREVYTNGWCKFDCPWPDEGNMVVKYAPVNIFNLTIDPPAAPTVTMKASSYSMPLGNYFKGETVTLSWNAVSGAEYYWLNVVYAEGSSTEHYTVLNENMGTSTSYKFTPPTPGLYYFTLQACNSAGSNYTYKEFRVRNLSGKHWTSGTALGNTKTTFSQGDTVYFNFKLFDEKTGDFWTSYSSLSFPVKLEIKSPDGTVKQSGSFDYSSTGQISYKCTESGTYTAVVHFNNSVYSNNFTVNKRNFTVNFVANGGTCDTSSMTVEYGKTCSSLPTPTKEDWVFLGWYESTSVDAYGVPTSKKFTTSNTITKNTTLYALWSKSEILMFGDATLNGIVDFKDVIKINKYSLGKQTPENADVFIISDVDANGEINNDDVIYVNKLRTSQIKQTDLPVYSAWRGLQVITLPKTTYSYGEILDTTGLTIKATYSTFDGYVINGGFTVSGYDPYKIGTQKLTVNYFQYSCTYYVTVNYNYSTVTYNGNGGTGIPESQTKEHSKALILSKTIPTRRGYTFLGWATNKNATEAEYLSGSEFNVNANTTLYAVWAKGCPGSHNYAAEVISPTCISEGYTTYTCTDCDFTYSDNRTDALGHRTEVINNSEPTCTTNGYSGDTICTVCSAVVEKGNFISQLEHDFSTETIAPTCISDGYTEYTCVVCNYTFRDDYINMTGHGYESSILKIPTADARGVIEATCVVCDDYVTAVLPVFNEDYYIINEISQPSCTGNGVISYTLKDLTYGEISIEVTTDSIGHDYSKSTVVSPTCTERGYTEHVCANCGDTYTDGHTPALGHKTELVSYVAPTCTETGYSGDTVCLNCSEVIEKGYDLENLGHSYTQSVTAPTCTEGGYAKFTCKNCNDSYTGDYTDALGHSYEASVLKAPTAEAKGVLEATCTACGDYLTAVLPILSDEYYTVEVSAEPTCTERGLTVYTLKDTAYGTVTIEVVTDSLGHDYDSEVTAPTCTADGYTEYTCIYCGDSYKGDHVYALGHSYKDGACTVCGASAPSTDDSEYTLGDINEDGAINGKDSNQLKQFITGSSMPTASELLAADVNGDGAINGVDANIFAQFLSGAIGSFE